MTTPFCKDCVKGHCDRWEHLFEVVRFKPLSLNASLGKWRWFQVGAVQGILSRTVEAIDRCDCGGVFDPAKDGKSFCGCCGAPQHFATATMPEDEVGRTLREHLLLIRRRTASEPARKQTDDDVKVTIHVQD